MPVEIAIQLLLSLIDRASTISGLIQQAHASGAKELTVDQWTQIFKADDDARLILQGALNAIAIKPAAPTVTESPPPGAGVTPA